LNNVGHSACISSESHVISLNDSNTKELYVVFRTDAGFLGAARSLDGGQSFKLPHPSISNQFSATHYSEPGSAAEQLVRPLKNPRGPITPVVIPNHLKKNDDSADVLMLYYNNGHVALTGPEVGVWTNRNPYWLVPGYLVEDEEGKTLEWGVRVFMNVCISPHLHPTPSQTHTHTYRNLKLHCTYLELA